MDLGFRLDILTNGSVAIIRLRERIRKKEDMKKQTKEEKNHYKAYMIGADSANLCFDKTRKEFGSIDPVNIHGFVSGYLQTIANLSPNRKSYKLLMQYSQPFFNR